MQEINGIFWARYAISLSDRAAVSSGAGSSEFSCLCRRIRVISTSISTGADLVFPVLPTYKFKSGVPLNPIRSLAMFRRRRRYWIRQASRFVVGSLIVSHLASAGAMPLPVPRISDSRPQACMSHGCGCHIAEQPGKPCCCCRPESPVAGSLQSISLRKTDADSELRACCRRPGAKAFTISTVHSRSPVQPTAPTGWVLRISASQCRGTASAWIAKGSISSPLMLEIWQPLEPKIGTVSLLNQFAERTSTTPPLPPPRPSAT